MKDSKKTAVADSVTEDTSVETDTQPHAKAGPIWTTESGRVRSAMFRHEQKGKVRFTVAVSRSYLSKKTGDWVDTHFFDRNDLADVKAVVDRATVYLAEVMDKVEA